MSKPLLNSIWARTAVRPHVLCLQISGTLTALVSFISFSGRYGTIDSQTKKKLSALESNQLMFLLLTSSPIASICLPDSM
ncbi:hypothetical protein FKM82_014798 [Ascaphus truei]